MVLFGLGCATSQVQPGAITHEQQAKIDQTLSLKIFHRLEPELKFKLKLEGDEEITSYLSRLAGTLAVTMPEPKIPSLTNLHGGNIGFEVSVIKQKDRKWRNFGLPDNRIFLSVDLLRILDFENEVAAVLAVELGHLQGRDIVAKISENKDEVKALAKTETIFAFSEDVDAAAVEKAVGILYYAGFDPRGLVSLWEKYQNNVISSPYDPNRLKKLLDVTRRKIALNAPLRNPIINSKEFLRIQTRMKSL